ncbi:MAG: hypothetical protein ACRDJE_14270, partial [Dehalococcoidia bacterium]
QWPTVAPQLTGDEESQRLMARRKHPRLTIAVRRGLKDIYTIVSARCVDEWLGYAPTTLDDLRRVHDIQRALEWIEDVPL